MHCEALLLMIFSYVYLCGGCEPRFNIHGYSVSNVDFDVYLELHFVDATLFQLHPVLFVQIFIFRVLSYVIKVILRCTEKKLQVPKCDLYCWFFFKNFYWTALLLGDPKILINLRVYIGPISQLFLCKIIMQGNEKYPISVVGLDLSKWQ